MRRLPGKLLTLLAVAAFAAAPASPAWAKEEKEEKPQKESRDVKQGKAIHVQVTSAMGVYDDLELQEYVQRIGERLAAQTGRPDLEWKFTIVDTDDVNAFATTGGFVYLSRGFFPYIQNEAQLAAVIGHEIGHNVAEHSKKQQRKGMLTGLASAATAIFTGLPQLAEITNVAGSALIHGYGREAELEADALAAQYLAKAGYDPNAMIDVIRLMKAQDSFERERARLEKRDPRIYHGVFSTHPDNDTRLKQAVSIAGRVPATGDTSNAAGYEQAIEGVAVGSSRRQGMIRDNRFYHADLQFTLAFPRNWQIVNSPQQLLAIAPNKEHVMEMRTQAPPSDVTDPRAFVMRGLANRRLSKSEDLEINGLKAFTTVVRGDPSPYGQSTNVRYIVIYYDTLMWVFKCASRAGDESPSGDPLFLSTANTFRRMRASEFQLAEPYRLHLVQATEGATFEQLAKESPIKKYPEQELRLYNNAYPEGEPKPGDRIRIVE